MERCRVRRAGWGGLGGRRRRIERGAISRIKRRLLEANIEVERRTRVEKAACCGRGKACSISFLLLEISLSFLFFWAYEAFLFPYISESSSLSSIFGSYLGSMAFWVSLPCSFPSNLVRLCLSLPGF